jgi:hypothetical protein
MKRECIVDRKPFDFEECWSLNPMITQLAKTPNNLWEASIVDMLRQPLDHCVLIHRCGAFYNLQSLHSLYGNTAETISISQYRIFLCEKESLCAGCLKSFQLQDTVVGYPRATTDAELEDEHSSFSSLNALYLYQKQK